jgi:hypothetical protein
VRYVHQRVTSLTSGGRALAAAFSSLCSNASRTPGNTLAVTTYFPLAG